MSYKSFDQQYRNRFPLIAGVDEVGRGPLAGPVVVAAVILRPDFDDPGICDSKQLSAKKRQLYHNLICKNCLSYSTAIIDAEIIDEVNILNATKLAMHNAINALSLKPDLVLVDAVDLKRPDCEAIIHGDAQSLSIAAASIIAKVERDRLMMDYDAIYPGYHFATNMGYGTPEHLAALERLGPCEIHRQSFAPVRFCALTSQSR